MTRYDGWVLTIPLKGDLYSSRLVYSTVYTRGQWVAIPKIRYMYIRRGEAPTAEIGPVEILTVPLKDY